MTNLAVRGSFQELLEEAKTLVQSGFLPRSITKPEQAVAIITMGRELGIGTWAALNGINVIQGKPTIAPQLMLGLINRSGQLADMQIEGDTTYCKVTMTRQGRQAHTETFTIEDARAMGLANKDNWIKQPSVMLKWRAVSACARVVFPDIIIGFYAPEEINPDAVIDYETGEVLEAVVDELPATTQPTQPPAAEAPSRKSSKAQREAMAPEELQGYISVAFAKHVETFDNKEAAYELLTDDAAKKLAIQWQNITGLKTDDRHAVSLALFGAASTKDYTVALADVCRNWLSKSPSVARSEAQLAINWIEADRAAFHGHDENG